MSDKDKTFAHGGSPPCACDRQYNPAKAVQIGGHTIWAGGGLYLLPEDLDGFNRLIDLRAERLLRGYKFGDTKGRTICLPIVDFSTVAEENWAEWKRQLEFIYGLMESNYKIVVFCAGGHGRTGLFLASLLALAEPDINDPVAKIRHRYCQRAVETAEQYAQVMRMLKETRVTRDA